MSDTERRLADIEKRLARLEKLTEKPPVELPHVDERAVVMQAPIVHNGPLTARGWQFCPCGRDVCRAPDCPTHRKGGE